MEMNKYNLPTQYDLRPRPEPPAAPENVPSTRGCLVPLLVFASSCVGVLGWLIRILAVVLMVMVPLPGCSAGHWLGTYPPGVQVSSGIFGTSFSATGNSGLHIGYGHVRYDPSTGEWEIQLNDAQADQEVKSVVEAQTALMYAVAEGQKTQAQYVGVLTNGIANVVGAAVPIFSGLRRATVTPSEGGCTATIPGMTAEQLRAYVERALGAIGVVVPASTTQPAKGGL